MTARSRDSAPQATALLLAWGQGNRAALDQFIPLVHHELLRRARGYVARERADMGEGRPRDRETHEANLARASLLLSNRSRLIAEN